MHLGIGALLLPSGSATRGTSYCFDTRTTFCATGQRTNTSVTFSVTTTFTGWVGIGFGKQMDGSVVVVGWNNVNSTTLNSRVTIDQRVGDGHSIKQGDSSLVSARLAIQFAFEVPLSRFAQSVDKPVDLIFGASNSAPPNPADASSVLTKHSLAGVFVLDMSGSASSSPSPSSSHQFNFTFNWHYNHYNYPNNSTSTTSTTNLILIHALCMFFAWTVVLPGGIFLARYLKYTIGPNWFLSHGAIMLLVGLLSIGDFGESRFFASTHGIIGTLIVLFLYPLQMALGVTTQQKFDPARSSIPVLDKSHWWTGRTIALLAIINIHLGLSRNNCSIGWFVGFYLWILVVLLVGFAFIGERVLDGPNHHSVPDPSHLSLKQTMAMRLRMARFGFLGGNANVKANANQKGMTSTKPYTANPSIPSLPTTSRSRSSFDTNRFLNKYNYSNPNARDSVWSKSSSTRVHGPRAMTNRMSVVVPLDPWADDEETDGLVDDERKSRRMTVHKMSNFKLFRKQSVDRLFGKQISGLADEFDDDD
ncbi:hypothetical protein BCR33DRAFT_719563 [Rhizoclosmatium globosum]|uniref:Cytochrome b561 domain-containing protein n=1 Tax=Rhizoclosmatium globosum TaxID=329046 RepID=A0A1Y2BZF5_9FUNG|nr:hypothetical protein BCR33DRAFT_719563 [Rhizoclosmatium globosum]|eukprot:ORY40173.1 hypothetical protein BCR33DRAFT_719563 [Rhizoclosmatium globosum]